LSLAAISPVEKSENLIYTILPVTIGLLIGSLISSDPSVWISFLAIVSPILTIFLYEIAPEEGKIKVDFKAHLMNHQNQSRSDFFNCNLFIRSWESTLQPFDGVTDTIVNDLSDFAGSVVSSFVARRHFWRLRATIYIRLSLPLLILLGIRLIDIGLRNIIVLIIGDFWWIVILGVCWVLISYGIDYHIKKARKSRIERAETFLDSYITYLYWHTMVGSDTARTPNEYQPSSIKGIVKNELDSLDRLLVRNDWDVFIQRWSRLSRNVMDLAENEFHKYFQSRAYKLWGQYIHENRRKRDTSIVVRQLEWLMYYASGTELPESEVDLLRVLKSGSEPPIGIKGLLDPTPMFSQIPRILLTEERDEADNARYVAEGINSIFNNSSGDVSQAVQKVVQELHNPQGVYNNTQLMAEFVMNYITERCQLGMKSFLGGYKMDVLKSLFGHVQSAENRVWLLMDWFQRAPSIEVGKALDDTMWRGVLLDPPLLRTIVNRLKRFDGGFSVEIGILSNFMDRLMKSGTHESELEELNQTYTKIQER